MLHIVNGDSVANKLRQGIVQDDILVWREVYPHGPVFSDSEGMDNRLVRAAYLEHTLGILSLDYIQISEAQEKALANCHAYEEIVLWFEHDLFDQTMLCYLLHRLSRLHLPKTKLSLLCIGEYPGIERFMGLGQLTVEQLSPLYGTWKLIGEHELKLGTALWEAYTSPNPQLLQNELDEDTLALPFAHEAFKMHLSRFPSTFNGLGIVEHTTLARIHAGMNTAYELFTDVGSTLHTLGMGDLEYAYHLREMSQAPHPLLQIGEWTEFPRLNPGSMPFPDAIIVLTELGNRVLTGAEDWFSTNGIDEWYGGVHLQGDSPKWRWNPERQCIQNIVI
ncbi:DUF1835 domain-containing protein [Paenibacillus wynnii]|uniref:ECF subfamily RNA polymerase sigma-24 factor n=1 Tax=Paenibacillus wynnii TaxID=268407 RepID=A0A098MFE1_9BACL|nr:DUF1835 domain-containing protein [Paenibacillus wynnii]KGE20257.1 ECF subfamily RNA polymerase sigma-24 factor [Paenibacillus wynnii]